MTYMTHAEKSVNGGRAAILVCLADTAMRARDWDTALDYFTKARELTQTLDHSRGKMHYIALNLARIDHGLGNFSDALSRYENLVESLDWLMPDDILIMADCHEQLGNTAKAATLALAAKEAQAELDAEFDRD